MFLHRSTPRQAGLGSVGGATGAGIAQPLARVIGPSTTFWFVDLR